MSPLRRGHVNKHKSARKFRRNTGRTKMGNFTSPMRGGLRI